MASLDSLPADQRAVIQLVLQQRRSYDDIAAMLSIDRAGVRQRALDAFDALGPENSIPAPQRALLTDYLLGQLPHRVADQVHDSIADSPAERAWLRVVASEVGGLATAELPPIPAPGAGRAAGSGRAAGAGAAAAGAGAGAAAGAGAGEDFADEPAAAQPAPAASRRRPARTGSGQPARTGSGQPAHPAPVAAPGPRPQRPAAGSSRRGGAILLGAGAAVIIAAIVVVILFALGGGSSKPHAAASRSSSTPTSAATGSPTSSTTPATTTTKAKLLTAVNLNSPAGVKGRAGVAQVISQGSTLGVLLIAQKMPANSKRNAYALWLYNSASDSHLVGFVDARVGSSGRLETEGALPANASHYKHMLVTLETQQSPKTPGPVILEGTLNLP